MPARPFTAATPVAPIFRLPVAAATRIYVNGLVAVDAQNNAVPAVDAAGLKVQGVCIGVPYSPVRDEFVDNSAGAAGAAAVEVKCGVYRLRNSTAAPLTSADLGKLAVVEDESTVAKSSAHQVAAGVLLALEPGYAWLWIMPPAGYIGTPGLQTFNLSQPVATP